MGQCEDGRNGESVRKVGGEDESERKVGREDE